MEFISQAKSEKFQKGSVTSWEYITESPVLNVARIKINGRYPEEGFTSNREADSIVHIIGGAGAFGMNDNTLIEIAPHDQLHIAANDAYFFEGDLEIIYSASPKWHPEQTERID